MRAYIFSITLLLTTSALFAEDSKKPQSTCERARCYTIPERLLRLCYFRSAVAEEDYLLSAINSCCDLFHINSWSTDSFNPIVSEVAIKIFKMMGGKESYVSTRDGNGVVHSLTLRAKDLESQIEAHGGSWVRIHNGKSIQFAVISPKNASLRWKAFASSCFALLHWPKQQIALPTGEEIEAFISCENADLIDDCQCHGYCFLHCHANSHSFIGEGERAGLYLGMKQDICFFDHRGVGLSRGIPSEVAYYLDIEAVYDNLRQSLGYSPENIWVGGFCAGCPIAAHLKLKLHQQGINYFAEQGFADLARDFIETRTPIVRWIGRRSYGGLKSFDISPDFLGRPEEYQFSIERMWAELTYETKSKVIILHTTNDQHLGESVRTQFIEAAQKVSRNVFPVFYRSDVSDPHSDAFYFYPEVKRKFTEIIFKN